MTDAEIIELVRARVEQSVDGEPDQFVSALIEVLQAGIDQSRARTAAQARERFLQV